MMAAWLGVLCNSSSRDTAGAMWHGSIQERK